MDSYQVEIDNRAKDVVALSETEGRTKSEQLEHLLLTAPTLSDEELQGFDQVQEWMNPETVSEI